MTCIRQGAYHLVVKEGQGVAEHLRPESAGHADAQSMNVRNHDDGTLVGDVLVEAELRQASPVLVRQRRCSIREEAILLAEASRDDGQPPAVVGIRLVIS